MTFASASQTATIAFRISTQTTTLRFFERSSRAGQTTSDMVIRNQHKIIQTERKILDPERAGKNTSVTLHSQKQLPISSLIPTSSWGRRDQSRACPFTLKQNSTHAHCTQLASRWGTCKLTLISLQWPPQTETSPTDTVMQKASDYLHFQKELDMHTLKDSCSKVQDHEMAKKAVLKSFREVQRTGMNFSHHNHGYEVNQMASNKSISLHCQPASHVALWASQHSSTWTPVSVVEVIETLKLRLCLPCLQPNMETPAIFSPLDPQRWKFWAKFGLLFFTLQVQNWLLLLYH